MHVIVCLQRKAGKCLTEGTKLLLLGQGERLGGGKGVNAVSVFPPTPQNQEQCNTTVGNRSLLYYSYGSTASKRKKKFILQCGKMRIFFSISLSAIHMLLWVSALSRTFSQQFRMQVDNGGKELVKLKNEKENKNKAAFTPFLDAVASKCG